MDKRKAILFAFLAAVFYAVNVPVSKVLLQEAGPATMAALLYQGPELGSAPCRASCFPSKGRTASGFPTGLCLCWRRPFAGVLRTTAPEIFHARVRMRS